MMTFTSAKGKKITFDTFENSSNEDGRYSAKMCASCHNKYRKTLGKRVSALEKGVIALEKGVSARAVFIKTETEMCGVTSCGNVASYCAEFPINEVEVQTKPKIQMEATLYKTLLANNVPHEHIGNHYSDLYVRVTDTSTAIIKEWIAQDKGLDSFPSTFRSQLPGEGRMYDISFAFDPWWEERGITTF